MNSALNRMGYFPRFPLESIIPIEIDLDRIALGREIARLNQERDDLGRRVAKGTSHAQALAAQFEAQCLQTVEAGRQAGALAAELEAQRLRTAEAIRQAEAPTVELGAQRRRTAEAIRQAEAPTVELEAQRLRTAEAIRQAEALAIEIDALRRSWSWRATAWLRWLSTRTVPRAS